LTARAQPKRFCYALTLASSGLAYVVAVLCIYLLGRPLRLPLSLRLLLTASFALATVAFPYPRHVNNHIPLPAVTAALLPAPANAVAEYFEWPGCPFNPHNMTGAWNHSVGHFLTYAAALLAGKRGFLGHNLPLVLAAAGLVVLVRRRTVEWPEVVFGGCWCGG